MFDTKEEANQKLSGCVVLFNDSPVYVSEAQGKGNKLGLRYTHLRSKEERFNSIHESGWDFKNLGERLGYTNVDLGKGSYQEALYVTRKAIRRTQSCQGISAHNIAFGNLRGSQRLGLPQSQLSFSQMYASPYFLDMMEKKYPSLPELERSFDKSFWTSRAFNRQFAVRRHDIGPYYLEYREKDIGYTQDFHRWKIADEYNHLRETLDYLNLRIA